MEYLKDMWWHQCNDFHGSLWLSKGVNQCCHCGFKKLEMSKTDSIQKFIDFIDGGNK